ncbi:hypothetical protein CALCODRAFT_333290 [Calocera cornea HHB12733]|uniref:Uncharacterized protein n=1 Tax=Calocera cornea HHB12733 TaxID=1353952 RepID=A0A165F1N4_9BASI|nr:hypothetical protein CALCODRAFT_333290 [Calocera cornea HHB12733]
MITWRAAATVICVPVAGRAGLLRDYAVINRPCAGYLPSPRAHAVRLRGQLVLMWSGAGGPPHELASPPNYRAVVTDAEEGFSIQHPRCS